MRKAEKTHLHRKLESVKDNLGKTWNILKSLISPYPKKEAFEEIISNNKILSDPKQIAHSFNSFFANIGPNLAATIPATPHKFTEYLKPMQANSLFMKPADCAEIKQVIH